MSWQIVERRLGRAGGIKERNARQRGWDDRYGDGNWAIGYISRRESQDDTREILAK